MKYLKTIERNLNGRDFVVGDLHGCLKEFNSRLKDIDFDPVTDRVFSVGDLIDRGPESMACLELLRNSWFHCVRGNHEDMLLEFNDSPNREFGMNYEANGGSWAIQILRDTDQSSDRCKQLQELIELVRNLPFALIVTNKDDFKVGICHAESPISGEWTEEGFKNDYLYPEPVGWTIESRALWGRTRIQATEEELRLKEFGVITGVDKVYHGHTPTKKPIRRFKQNWIDTGCFATGKLWLEEI